MQKVATHAKATRSGNWKSRLFVASERSWRRSPWRVTNVAASSSGETVLTVSASAAGDRPGFRRMSMRLQPPPVSASAAASARLSLANMEGKPPTGRIVSAR